MGGEGENTGGAEGVMGYVRGIVGRWPDADQLLEGGMSDGLRDWDLWYDTKEMMWLREVLTLLTGDRYSSAYCSPSC